MILHFSNAGVGKSASNQKKVNTLPVTGVSGVRRFYTVDNDMINDARGDFPHRGLLSLPP